MIENGRPLVLRRGTVLTMNDTHDILRDADVLIVGEEIAGVGQDLDVPDGTYEIDASDGIVMPGMTMPSVASISAVPSGTSSDGPTAAISSPPTSTSASRRMSCASFMVSTVPRRNTTGLPFSIIGVLSSLTG
jgi:hypothetical protein